MRVTIRDWEIDIHWPRKPPSEVFVRFGLWDTHRNESINFGTGEYERGLSVYRGVLSNDLVVGVHPGEDVHELVEGRLAFPVMGRVVGIGSDGEPLLKGVRCLPYPLAVDIAKRIGKPGD